MSFFNTENKTILVSGAVGAVVGAAAVLIYQELFPSEGKKMERQLKKVEKEMQEFANTFTKETR